MDNKKKFPPSVSLIQQCSPVSVEPYMGRFQHLVIALFVLTVLSCAKQGFPPGGPVDKIPPSLVKSTPSQLAVNVPKKEPVVFEFSESMDTKSVEDNLFIVPIPSSWPEYEWKSKDKELILHFEQPFRENTTYVISVGSKACDLRRNQLEESIMLSFSTWFFSFQKDS